MAWIETDTASNQNIASAAAIGAYTATADKIIIVDVCIDQVAGSGDYVMYITKQIAGAGSAYVILPKTTMTAAAGETAISGQSGMIAVRTGDVLTCYVDGLAGDTTTPDYITRWFELEFITGSGGTLTLTYTVNKAGGGVLEGATVKLYSDSARSTLVTTKTSDVLGQVTFTNLVAGTYYLTTTMSGYTDMLDSEVVS